MGFLIAFVLLTIVVLLVRNSVGGGNLLTSAYASDALARRGLHGRGLVLQASQNSFPVAFGTRRFNRVTMTLDVEVPGRAPYVVSGVYLVPRGQVEAIPGASLDVAVDRRNPNRIAVLGPGGRSGPWLNLGQPNTY